MSKLKFRHTLDERHLFAQAEVYARKLEFCATFKIDDKKYLENA